jgi:hypothetical protein
MGTITVGNAVCELASGILLRPLEELRQLKLHRRLTCGGTTLQVNLVKFFIIGGILEVHH